MENASKALIIAGGILVAILVLGAIVLAWTAYSNFANEQGEAKDKEQILEFNKSFESYQKSLLRGTDVASVINKVKSNNKMFEDEIKWEFVLKDNIELNRVVVLSSGTYNENNSEVYDNFIKNSTYFAEFKRLYFKCSGIKYNSKTGKVNEITFEQIEKSKVQEWLNTI